MLKKSGVFTCKNSYLFQKNKLLEKKLSRAVAMIAGKRCVYIKFGLKSVSVFWLLIIIIIIIKRGWQCKAGRERLTPYQSEDPNPHNTNP